MYVMTLIYWCGKPESNRHGENLQQILSLLRLPVPPYPQNQKTKNTLYVFFEKVKPFFVFGSEFSA